MTEPVVASVDEAAARPIPASIPMPDHALRSGVAYQLFERLWRPALGWISCPVAVLYACVIAPAIGRPLEEGYLVQVLSFAGVVYLGKTYEKTKGVA